MKKLLFICLLALICSYQTAQAQDQMLGEIRLFSGNFAPKGWAICDGKTLPIAQNQALYAVIGNTYGGDGKTTFALPDLRGRVPAGVGNDTRLGEKTDAKTGFANATDSHEEGIKVAPQLGVHYIIALQGMFPQRD